VVSGGEAKVEGILSTIDSCKKPCLVFDDSGMRSSAICVAHAETRRLLRSVFSEDAESAVKGQASTHADSMPSSMAVSQSNRPLIDFVRQYVDNKAKNAASRMAPTAVNADMYISGQLTNEDLKNLAAAGVKTVVNVRHLEEAGELGFGMLVQEKEVCDY
jgi:protein tyrosine phosphatase (PTP) superfamily phosphohydrolase (DUF442 family)